jgi:hypothetical protein
VEKKWRQNDAPTLLLQLERQQATERSERARVNEGDDHTIIIIYSVQDLKDSSTKKPW